MGVIKGIAAFIKGVFVFIFSSFRFTKEALDAVNHGLEEANKSMGEFNRELRESKTREESDTYGLELKHENYAESQEFRELLERRKRKLLAERGQTAHDLENQKRK
ncbi:hypothetical protein A3750_04790 [Oleiphilus sp. HI0079]|nr:hypothetical protein A3750_04790 [Oleiphilus sp. HI0079]